MSSVRLDSAKPVRQGEELDTGSLDAFLATALPDLSGDLVVEQFPSGFSNLTYLIRKGERALVLRRPPFGVQVRSGHDMAREHRILSALSRVYPLAPKPLVFSDDESVIGAPFYVMERREGVILRSGIPKGLEITPERMRSMCDSLVAGLADLHAVDVQRAGLSDLGNPDGYVRRQVEGWIKRFDKARTGPTPEIDRIGAWLRERIPAESGATLVHNDYKFDNVMLSPADPTKIIAVLDWELCTIGDPLLDLGTTLGYWIQPSDNPILLALPFGPTAEPGAFTRAEVAEAYAEKTGRDLSNILYYYVFGLLKIGGIVQQIFYRYEKGFTQDPRFSMLDKVVELLGQRGVAAIEQGRV